MNLKADAFVYISNEEVLISLIQYWLIMVEVVNKITVDGICQKKDGNFTNCESNQNIGFRMRRKIYRLRISQMQTIQMVQVSKL